MQKYFLVFKQATQDLLEYKADFFLSTLKYSLMVLLMSIVWLNVEKNGQVGLLNKQETISYFLMSAMLYTLSNFHPWYIEDDINRGTLSKYLVKPLSPTIYYFCFELARVALDTILKLVVFLSILYFLNLLPNLTITHVILLLLYCPFIFLFSFQWLSLISILAFWVTEAYAIRWAVTIFTRLVSGILVPIVYFPDYMQKILYILPFEHLAFTPIQFMLGKMTFSLLAESFAILLAWIVAITIFRQWVWNRGLNQFEGTGI